MGAAIHYKLGQYELAAQMAQKAKTDMRSEELSNPRMGAVGLTLAAAEGRMGRGLPVSPISLFAAESEKLVGACDAAVGFVPALSGEPCYKFREVRGTGWTRDGRECVGNCRA